MVLENTEVTLNCCGFKAITVKNKETARISG